MEEWSQGDRVKGESGMRKHTLALGFVVFLLVVGVVSTSLGAEPPNVSGADDVSDTVQKSISLEAGQVKNLSRFLWSILPLTTPSTTDAVSSWSNNGDPMTTSTPVSPLLDGASVSMPPEGRAGLVASRPTLSARARELAKPDDVGAPVQESFFDQSEGNELAVRRAEALRQAGVRYHVPDRAMMLSDPRAASPTSPSEVCVEVILNSQMDVVQTPTGNYAEPWNFPIGVVYFSPEVYYSPDHSLYMMDETDGSDQQPADGDDYDQFGQAFFVPQDTSSLTVTYNRAYLNANDDDTVWSNIFLLDGDGYPIWPPVNYRTIGADSGTWGGRTWDLNSSEIAQVKGRTVALIFDMLSDRTDPAEWIFLDDAQVTICYERGAHVVYLPLVAKGPGSSSAPTCAPREPDSVAKPGTTTVDATCSGSLGSVDEKDYYSLNLDGATEVRLRLFNLPSGTNWDAMIYEDVGGYPLACQIGTVGDQDKSANCSLKASKDYFVLVSRGPEKDGGPYTMSVERR